MNQKKILVTAALLWVSIQVSGIFNDLMGFDFGQSLLGSAVSAAILAVVYLYIQKVSKKTVGEG